MNVLEKTKKRVEKAIEATKAAIAKSEDSVESSLNAFGEYAFEKKEVAAAELKKRLNFVKLEIEKIRRDADDQSEVIKEKYEHAIEALQEKRAELELRVEITQNATEETWDQVSLDTKKKWNEIREALAKAKNSYN